MTELDSCSVEWAQAQVKEFAKRRRDHVMQADVLRQVLEHVAARYAPLAIVQARAKDIPSFAEKCMRKCRKYREPVDQLTDLCGGRIIVHTQDQVEEISRFIEEHFEIDWANSEDAGKRLKASEFGYQSVHYIVTFKRGVFPAKGFPVDVPDRLYGGAKGMANPRAEVQVRTILQHAWADIGHDLLYKGSYDVPDAWRREFARLAAILETSDDVIDRAHAGLRRFESSYGAYMTPQQMTDELALLQFVRLHDPDNVALAIRIADIAMASCLWSVAIEALEPHAADDEAEVLCRLGEALCASARSKPTGRAYKRGQRLLEKAAEDEHVRGRARLALAASWRGVNESEAETAYRVAYETSPDDPYALAGHLEYQVSAMRETTTVTAAGAAVGAAIETCAARAAVGLDIPHAYLTAGFLHLLRGDAYEALDDYAKGVQLARTAEPVSDALASLERIARVGDRLEGYPWMQRLLTLALAARFPEPATVARVKALGTPGAAKLVAPVIFVAGGCDPAKAEQFERYRAMIVGGLSHFCGTVISGGTVEGVSGFVGDAAAANPTLKAVSHLPQNLPLDATVDRRYSDLRRIADSGFTPMGPLQAWTDVVASGISPADVRLLGVNGGRISAAEYRIALALGALVALVEDSGREAGRLLPDVRWGLSDRLAELPADAASVEALVTAPCGTFDESTRERLAQMIHEEYLTEMRSSAPQDNPSLASWDSLREDLRESNFRQADHIFAKLDRIGIDAVPVGGRPVKVMRFKRAEIEMLAEVEHGSWVAEKAAKGWRRGAAKDPVAKTHPCLVPWTELPDSERRKDREGVAKIPSLLARVGLELRRRGPGSD